MIVKKRDIPLKIHKLDALYRRLPELHPSRPEIKADLEKSRAGRRGEEALDYHLAFLSGSRHMMFHGLRLRSANGYFFQMDTVILCPNVAIILETKNITGTLFFDQSFHQLVRTQENSEDVFADPLLQIRRQKRQLLSWLARQNITGLPVAAFVVISFPTTKITADPAHQEVFHKVIHAGAIPHKIEEIHQLYSNRILSEKEMKKAARQLTTQHVPHNPDLLTKFRLSESELLTGVQCPFCQHIPMKRTRGKWSCPRCCGQSVDAHIQALADYALLHNHTITNKTLREYLQLDSRSIATRLLKELNLPFTGSQKNRLYRL